MQAFVEWITQIVLFLIMASVIDLLIPANNMKKYIKLVVGLILILILLKPVFYVFQTAIHEDIQKHVSGLVDTQTESGSIENLINFQKREIQASSDAYILEQMAVQLIDIAKDRLETEENVAIEEIEFSFTSENEKTYENLEEVIVFMRDSISGEGTVGIVKDVVIISESEADPLEVDRDNATIEALLREVWELDHKELTIVWEGGTS